MPEGSEEQTEACWRLEERVVERYKDQKSTDNKKMRKELQEVSLKLSLANENLTPHQGPRSNCGAAPASSTAGRWA